MGSYEREQVHWHAWEGEYNLRYKDGEILSEEKIKPVYSRRLLQEKRSRNKGLHHAIKDSSLMTARFMWYLLNRSQLSLRMGFPEKFLH